MSGIGRSAALLLLAITLLPISGCAVVAVADAVVTTAAVVVKTGVKATGAVIGAVLPD
jgi:ABC-type Na+ transport system ATPase subunit NatA